MKSKILSVGIASAMVVSACSGVARPVGRALDPQPRTADSSATSSTEADTFVIDLSVATTTVAETAPVDVQSTDASSTSTTLAAEGPSSTTTNPTGSIDLGEVQKALDALDALFGDLDSQIGAVDLDEGETP